MTAAPERQEVERLRVAVSDKIGFAFQTDQLEQLGHTVRRRAHELGLEGLDAYVARLSSREHAASETAALAELVTVTETFFCRGQEQIHALLEQVVPLRAAGARRLRIVSAGCASGEEPYSIAIALAEMLPDLDAWDVKIFGLDVNRGMLRKAERGRYGTWSLRATPERLKARHFEKQGREFVLSERIRRLVEFRELNLVEPNPFFFRALAADAVFCRNVLMYFTPEAARGVVRELTSALLPDGFLFLGHAETLRGISHDYHLCHTHETFYYQRRQEPGTPAPGSRSPLPVPDAAPPPELDGTNSWFEAISAASQRIDRLLDAGHGPARARPSSATPGRAAERSELTRVLELIERERFEEALAVLDALPPDAGAQPDALLLSAVLLTNNGRISDAERTCRKLLASDDLHAGAHYLTALCREHAGDAEAAAEHDRIAVHLDPTFSMPHLHAGLLAKRAGDRGAARRELGEALLLLEREDTSRLVLFGGGFSRSALTALCRSELGRLGGAS